MGPAEASSIQSCVVVSVGTAMGEPARDSRVLPWDGGGSVGGGGEDL